MNGQMISWTRSDLKWRAKQAFRKNYWSVWCLPLCWHPVEKAQFKVAPAM